MDYNRLSVQASVICLWLFSFTLNVSSTYSQRPSWLTNKALVNSCVMTSDPCGPSLQINTLALHFLPSQRTKHREKAATFVAQTSWICWLLSDWQTLCCYIRALWLFDTQRFIKKQRKFICISSTNTFLISVNEKIHIIIFLWHYVLKEFVSNENCLQLIWKGCEQRQTLKSFISATQIQQHLTLCLTKGWEYI